jgi:mono/diheme cytochrome c family protein
MGMKPIFLALAALVIAVLGVAAPYAARARSIAGDSIPTHFGIGRPATHAEVARIDIDVRADGRGLPTGSGTPAAGAKVYAAKCAVCHGKSGEGMRTPTVQLGPALVGRKPGDAFDFNASMRNEATKTIGNYWPHATTIFDYVRRAMPYDRPGSLSDAEVYAVTAYLLQRNRLIDSAAVIDAKTLPLVLMPSRDKFVRDDREGSRSVR